ncbi:MAG: hypothetical protein F6K04_26900, partial [Leptolyngbya sp. SIO4C5]|nr:hypothetical protein [Leptolyngbya sp. SIO4C5]
MTGFRRRQLQVVSSLSAALLGGLLSIVVNSLPAKAQLNSYCHLSQAEVTRKENLRQALVEGDEAARQQYESLVQQHANQMRNCRNRTWPQQQATWIRLYPCDLQPHAASSADPARAGADPDSRRAEQRRQVRPDPVCHRDGSGSER